jgi:hypothetical protein
MTSSVPGTSRKGDISFAAQQVRKRGRRHESPVNANGYDLGSEGSGTFSSTSLERPYLESVMDERGSEDICCYATIASEMIPMQSPDAPESD